MTKIKELDQKLLKILKKHPKGINRFNICKILKLNTYTYQNIIYGRYTQIITLHHKRTTIYDHLRLLKLSGKIINFQFRDGSQGRPTILWKLNKKFE